MWMHMKIMRASQKALKLRILDKCGNIWVTHILLRDKNNNFVEDLRGISFKCLVKSQFYRFATGMKVYGVQKIILIY
jgi:hypothetical protein